MTLAKGQPPGRKSVERHSILPAGGCSLGCTGLRRLGLTPAQARAKGFATLWTPASPLRWPKRSAPFPPDGKAIRLASARSPLRSSLARIPDLAESPMQPPARR